MVYVHDVLYSQALGKEMDEYITLLPKGKKNKKCYLIIVISIRILLWILSCTCAEQNIND